MLTAYASDEAYPPRFWNKYNCKKLSLKLSGGKVCKDYGICRWNVRNDCLDYWIGIKTDDAKGDISETVQIHIPEGLYALFNTPAATHFDFVNTIHKTWEYINKTWFPSSGYQHNCSYEFESYVEASRIFSEEIYIPIKKIEGEAK